MCQKKCLKECIQLLCDNMLDSPALSLSSGKRLSLLLLSLLLLFYLYRDEKTECKWII